MVGAGATGYIVTAAGGADKAGTMDQAVVEQVLSQVDEQAIVELASDLIRIPSFKTEETPVATFLAEFVP